MNEHEILQRRLGCRGCRYCDERYLGKEPCCTLMKGLDVDKETGECLDWTPKPYGKERDIYALDPLRRFQVIEK